MGPNNRIPRAYEQEHPFEALAAGCLGFIVAIPILVLYGSVVERKAKRKAKDKRKGHTADQDKRRQRYNTSAYSPAVRRKM